MPVLNRLNDLIETATGRRLVKRSEDPRSISRRDVVRALGDLGQLSFDEARFLGELVRKSAPDRPIIEVGTLFGWSTIVISLFKQPEQQLITIDNYSWNPLRLSPEEHLRVTTDRLAPLVASQNVVQLNTDKADFYARYDGPAPALFFCDADHSYEATKNDLDWAMSVHADTICGDDYSPSEFPGVVRAVTESGGAMRVVDELFVLTTQRPDHPTA